MTSAVPPVVPSDRQRSLSRSAAAFVKWTPELPAKTRAMPDVPGTRMVTPNGAR